MDDKQRIKQLLKEQDQLLNRNNELRVRCEQAEGAELSAVKTVQKLADIVHGMAHAVLLLTEPEQLAEDREEAARQLRAHAGATKKMLEGWGLSDPLEGALEQSCDGPTY